MRKLLQFFVVLALMLSFSECSRKSPTSPEPAPTPVSVVLSVTYDRPFVQAEINRKNAPYLFYGHVDMNGHPLGGNNTECKAVVWDADQQHATCTWDQPVTPGYYEVYAADPAITNDPNSSIIGYKISINGSASVIHYGVGSNDFGFFTVNKDGSIDPNAGPLR